jgi:hypothetical protein
MLWPRLESAVDAIEASAAAPSQGPARSERELLEEVLDTVRSLSRGDQTAMLRGRVQSRRLQMRVHEYLKTIGAPGAVDFLASNEGTVVIRTTGPFSSEAAEAILAMTHADGAVPAFSSTTSESGRVGG